MTSNTLWRISAIVLLLGALVMWIPWDYSVHAGIVLIILAWWIKPSNGHGGD